MTISIVGTPVFSSTQATTTLTINLPSNSAGDYIVLLVGNGEDSPQPSITTAPSGYTEAGTLGFYDYGPGGLTTHCYYRVSTGGLTTASITWNTGDSNGGGLWALAIIVRTTLSWHSTAPVTFLSGTYSSSASSSPAPDQFSLSNLGHAVHFLQTSDNNNSTIGTANGWTLRGGGNTTDGSDGSIHVADQTFTTTGTKNHPIWSLDLGPDVFSWRTLLFREESSARTGTVQVSSTITPTATGKKATSRTVSVPVSATFTLVAKKAVSRTASVSHATAVTLASRKGAQAGVSLPVTVTGPAVTGVAEGTNDISGTVSVSQSSSVTTTGRKQGQGVVSVAASGAITAQVRKTGAVSCTVTSAHSITASGGRSVVASVVVTATTLIQIEAGATYLMKRYPNVILASSHLAGAYTDIDEDPSNPDGSWLTFAA